MVTVHERLCPEQLRIGERRRLLWLLFICLLRYLRRRMRCKGMRLRFPLLGEMH